MAASPPPCGNGQTEPLLLAHLWSGVVMPAPLAEPADRAAEGQVEFAVWREVWKTMMFYKNLVLRLDINER